MLVGGLGGLSQRLETTRRAANERHVPWWGVVRLLIAAYYAFAAEHRRLFAVMCSGGGAGEGVGRELEEQFARDIAEQMLSIQQDRATGATMYPYPTQPVASALVSALNRAVLWWMGDDGAAEDAEGDERQSLEALIDTMSRFITAASAAACPRRVNGESGSPAFGVPRSTTKVRRHMATTDLTPPVVCPPPIVSRTARSRKPYLGSTLDMARGPLAFLDGLHARYGPAATIQFMKAQRFVLFFTPAAVKYVLTEHPRNFTSGEFNDGLRWLLGDGLLVLDGETHRQQRRLVQPAFHKKRIEQYAGIMTEHTEQMLATWRDGETRDIALDLQGVTMRIVAKALFDADVASSSQRIGAAFNTIARWSSDDPFAWQNLLKFDLPFLPHGKVLRAARDLNAAIFALIEERRRRPADRGDVLSMLLERAARTAPR